MATPEHPYDTVSETADRCFYASFEMFLGGAAAGGAVKLAEMNSAVATIGAALAYCAAFVVTTYASLNWVRFHQLRDNK